MLEVPQEAIDLCVRWEGWRSKAYVCPAGILTIGYGHTGKDVYPGKIISLDEGRALLLADLEKKLRWVQVLCPGLIDGPRGRLAAILDFTFNLGEGRLRASTLRRKVNAGEWDEVPRELRKWVWGGGKKLPGLVLRREAEIALL